MLCIYKKKDPTDRGQAALLAQDNKTPQTRPLPPHALPAMASHPGKKSVFFGHYQFRLDPPPHQQETFVRPNFKAKTIT